MGPTMILLFKAAGLVVAALGSGIALFGEARKEGHLTLRGRISLMLIILGFLTSVILEVLQHRQRQESAINTLVQNHADNRWANLRQEPIIALDFRFLQQKEMPPQEFVDFVGGFTITLSARVTLPGDAAGHYTLRIGPRDAKQPWPDLRMVARASNGRGGMGKERVRLWRRGEPDTRLDSEVGAGEMPSGLVLSESRSFPNGWTHTYRWDFDWTDRGAMPSGFEAAIEWNAVDFEGQVTRAEDLPRIVLQLDPPRTCDRALLDDMCITLRFADGFRLPIPLHRYSFGPTVELNPFIMSGTDILASVEQGRKDEAERMLREYLEN